MTVRELLERTSSRELAEWMAYDRLEPFGEIRADLRAGVIASTMANIHRGKGTKVFSPADFIIDFDKMYRDDESPIDIGQKKIEKVMAFSAPKGSVRVYEGEAPPIRKLGKRGRSAKSGKRKF